LLALDYSAASSAAASSAGGAGGAIARMIATSLLNCSPTVAASAPLNAPRCTA